MGDGTVEHFPESLVRKSPEVESVGELEVADGVADLPEGVVGDVLDPVVGLGKKLVRFEKFVQFKAQATCTGCPICSWTGLC